MKAGLQRAHAARGGRPGAAHIVELWSVARCNEFAKGGCQPSDQSPTFHHPISPWAHSWPIPITARRRRMRLFVSDFCLCYDAFSADHGCAGHSRILQECYTRPHPQSRGHRDAPYQLGTVGGHDGKVRDADVDTVSGDGPLEQKTESDWVAVRNSHEVTDDHRATPTAAAKNSAGRPNRSLRDIIVPTSHAGIDVEQGLRARHV
jgi:hypothetical protein